MNSMKTVEMNEKSRKNHGGMLTQLLPSLLRVVGGGGGGGGVRSNHLIEELKFL